MKKIKLLALPVLSIIFIAVGILGIANVGFFNSTTGLEVLEIILGIGGLIVSVR